MAPPPRPPRLGRLLLRLRPLGDRRDEIDADLQELFARRRRERGARYAAWRYLIDAASLWRYRTRASITIPSRHSAGVHDVTQDIVFALRLFRRQPAGIALAVAGLALAIGITTAMFSVVNAIAFRGSGVDDSASVFRVTMTGPPRRTTGTATFGNWSHDDFRQLERTITTMRVMAAAGAGGPFRGPDDERPGDYLDVSAVSGPFFPTLGGRTLLGRALGPDDDKPGAARVVVLSYGFWKNRLNADRAIVGRTVTVGGQTFSVVGVMTRDFVGPTASPRVPAAPPMWTTLAAAADAARARNSADSEARHMQAAALEQRRDLDSAEAEVLQSLRDTPARDERPWNPPVDVFGRLAPQTTAAQAIANVNASAAAILNPNGRPDGPKDPTVRLTPIDSQGGMSELILVLSAVVAMVVLLACANVTNLLLARATARRHEIATRLAIGASRARIVRQLLTESVLLGLASGALGLVLAIVLAPVFARLLQISALVDVNPDLSVFAFVTAVAILTGLMAGLAPARHGRRTDLVASLKTDRSGATDTTVRSRLRAVLIGAQAACSIVLLVIAALFTRSLLHVAQFEIGFDPERLMSVEFRNSVGQNWDAARLATFREAILTRVTHVPGVANAAFASLAPFSGVRNPALPNGRPVTRQETTAGYFATVRIPVIRGRTYTADEVTNGAPVAVISARLAREYWGADDPLGSDLRRVWGPDDTPAESVARGINRRPAGTRIIGIVADTTNYLRRADAPTIYLPLGTQLVPRLMVAAERNARDVARGVRDALRTISPDADMQTHFVADGLENELKPPRDLATLAMFVGLFALLLAVIGLFGMTAFSVAQRSHEVSVRMALGATHQNVTRLVLGDSLRPVAMGLAAGLLLAWMSGSVIRNVLYGIDGHDPLALGAAVGILLVAAAAAAWIPARRAARVDPAEMLKGS